MQKKGIKIDLALNDEVIQAYKAIGDQMWTILGNVNGLTQKMEKEIANLKSLDVAKALTKLTDIENASEKIGIPLTPELIKIKRSLSVIAQNSDTVSNKMYSLNDGIMTAINSFADKWGK